jgi:crotonobetainyl-CoA:carnitine CoA-transferase CaiB-like acyl-CoA transferase
MVTDRALDGVRVVELAEGLAGAYCGKLLADLGAEVVLVERPGGHPLRRHGPTRPGAAHSGLFAHLATNKLSAVLEAPDGDLLAQLLAGGDILLTDGAIETPRLPRFLPPQLVHVDISPFGRTGPYADWKGSEITTWAMGGYMYFTGEKSREPLMLPGGQSSLHAGMHAALAALTGLAEQRQSGAGQAVEVSHIESVLSAHAWLTVAWSHAGLLLDRTTHDFIRCKDGWMNFMRIVHYPNVFILIDRPDLMDDPRWLDLEGWIANGEELWAMVAEWCGERTRAEVTAAAQELRIACCPVNDPHDLAESAQMAAREWWLDVEDGALGKVRLPGFPYRLSATPPAIRRPAPALGEHTAELTQRPRPVAHAAAAGGAADSGPLTGIRVVEVTSNWAGPVAGRHFADLGADVIKVEIASRPATRQGYWPMMDPQRQGFNRAGYFNQMNRGKRDVVLNLATPEGRDAFVAIIRQSDVLIENNSARVMPNLRLGYDMLSEVNPRLIMVSITGFGASGPERDYSAYGSNIEASCGLSALTGYEPSQVYRTGYYYADPVAGAHGAIAVLAALECRRRTGKGQWIDISLNECGAGFFAEGLIDYQLNGVFEGPHGNDDARFYPHSAFKCAGIDNWLALAVQSDDEWPSFCQAIGRADLADDPGLREAAGRRARAQEINEAVAGWAAGLEQYEAAWALQRAGVSAAPVLANWQLLADPHLYEREFYVPIEHPVVGVYPFPSWPWRFSRTPAKVRRHSPLFAEHNRQVLSEVGLSPEQIDALYESGVTSDEPAV